MSVNYEPPFETKDAATAAAAVAFAVTEPIKDILTGVRSLKARFAGTRIDDLADEESPSVRERLAQVDELLADGVIDAAEHAQQRTRILNEFDPPPPDIPVADPRSADVGC